jgi:hypothetical protein
MKLGLIRTLGMFLSGTPVYTIMLMGRWSLDAFMRYICKQILSLSHGIATKMLTYEQFYTVPDFVHNSADGDMRGHHNTNLAATSTFNGSHTNMRRGYILPLALVTNQLEPLIGSIEYSSLYL